MVAYNTHSDCDQTHGDINDKDKTDCTTALNQKCDFSSQFLIETYFENIDILGFVYDDPRKLVFNKCYLRSFEGHVNMVFQCPIDQNTLGVCPNNCIGVDSSAIVAGGAALVAGVTLSTLSVVPAILGGSALALIGGGTVAMMMTCQGPFYCRVGTRCCLVLLDPAAGIVCPTSC